MLMRSAAPAFTQINCLAIKIPHPGCTTEMAIKKKKIKIQRKTNLKREQQTTKTEVIQNKLSFPSTEAE